MMAAAHRHAAASRAYGRVHLAVMGGRPAEAEAFARAAALLRDAAERPAERATLARALGFNQKLWTIVQAEAMDPAHPAPPDVRRDMMVLARFMDQATTDALAAPHPRLGVMIEVNLCLSKGLFSAT
ncbi:MAG: hypothetical protein COW30_17725 [Rhodospirillales bacterium CG15_BIG_FIL_POST_REV_8_21_14_020_66_15]|nr:MAG: hypothetical protein COW30_17725 [Rhodospirillales bacterium CG15_BIG_FIL_POST_REV_8_21_14_020_66_15]